MPWAQRLSTPTRTKSERLSPKKTLTTGMHCTRCEPVRPEAEVSGIIS